MGWWAYRTMDTLGLTDEQIAFRVGVGSAAIRKFMGSPKGELGAESRAKMLAYYREVAADKQIPIDEPPVGFIVAGAGMGDTLTVPATYLSELRDYAALVARLVEQNAILMARLVPPPEPPIVGRAGAALEALEGAEDAAQPRSTSRPQRSDHAHRDEVESPASLEGEPA